MIKLPEFVSVFQEKPSIYITPLLALKKCRKKGNKDGAVRAFYQLQEGLGKVLELTGTKGISSVSALISYK